MRIFNTGDLVKISILVLFIIHPCLCTLRNRYFEKSLFSNCESLCSIILPKGLKSIRDDAFSRCRSLTSITLPEGLAKIEEDAFQQCEELSSISLPKSLISIGSKAFYSCTSLSCVNLPNALESLGDWVFAYCPSLQSMLLPRSIKEIEVNPFCKSTLSIESLSHHFYVENNLPIYRRQDTANLLPL